jgi:WD40 repeat protein
MKMTAKLSLAIIFLIGWIAQANEFQLYQMMDLGDGSVQQTIYSADDRFVVSLDENSNLVIWRGSTGQRMKTIRAVNHKPIKLLPHPTEQKLVTGGADATLRLWDLELGIEQGVLRGHLTAVNALAQNVGGNQLFSGSDDGTIIYWNTESGVIEKQILGAHQSEVSALAVHPKGDLLASADQDGILRFWNLPEFTLVREFQEHYERISILRFNDLGDRLLSGSEDGTVIVWDSDKQEMGFRLETGKPVYDLDLHPDAKTMITASAESIIRFWNFRVGEELPTQIKLESPANQIRFGNTGNNVMAALKNGQIQIWQSGGSFQWGSIRAHDRPVVSLSLTPDGKRLLTASSDKILKLWNTQSKSEEQSFDTDNHRVQSLLFSPSGSGFVTSGADAKILFWDLDHEAPVAELSGHQGKVNSITFSNDGTTLVSGDSDGKWILWDVITKEMVHHKQEHEDQVTSLALSPDGELLATGSADRSFKLWRTIDATLVGARTAHESSLTDIVFHPTRPLMATAGQDGLVKIWDLTNPQRPDLLHTIVGHSGIVHKIFFDSEGDKLISVSQDKTVRLWEVANGSPLRIIKSADTALIAASVDSERKRLAVGEIRGEVGLLSLETRTNPAVKRSNKNSITTQTLAEEINVLEVEEMQSTSTEDIATNAQNSVYGNNLNLNERKTYLSQQVQNTENSSGDSQMMLNEVLKRNRGCQDSEDIYRLAVESIQSIPDDKAAWHALAKVAATDKDFSFLMLSLVIGKDAKWHSDKYDYDDLMEVERNFRFWINQILDPSFKRQGGRLEISLKNCSSEQETLEVPPELYAIRPPDEFSEKVRGLVRLVDVRDFRHLAIPEFRRRMLVEIERVLDGANPYSNVRPPLPTEKVSIAPITGRLFLKLDRLATWRNAGEVAFELRRSGKNWRSYTTGKDMIAQLELPIGTYSLRVNGQLQQAFALNEAKETQLRP